MKNIFFIISLFLIPALGSSQNAVSQDLAQYVNKFTGDLSYSVPLMELPGPNGERFPLTATYYSGGIQTNQEASWLGLGWSMGIGEISRQVSGVPDDWNGKQQISTDFTVSYSLQNYSDIIEKLNKLDLDDHPFSGAHVPGFTNRKFNKFWGPLYFEEYGDVVKTWESVMNGLAQNLSNNVARDSANSILNTNRMDVFASTKFVSAYGVPFQFPSFDNYSINTPMLSGRMKLHLFEPGRITQYNDYEDYKTSDQFHSKPQFIMSNDGISKVKTSYAIPQNVPYDSDYPVSCISANGNLFTASTNCLYGGNIDYSDRPYDDEVYQLKMHTAVNIEYFTNEQMFEQLDLDLLHSSNLGMILTHQLVGNPTTDARFNWNKFDPDGIGYIRVTDTQGMTYHFSLPVYTYDEYVDSRNMDTFDSDISSSSTTTIEGELFIKEARYANSWKLTAITGPDYVDKGGGNNGEGQNYFPDEYDEGYWIRFDYGLYADDFHWRSPYWGAAYDMSNKRIIDPHKANNSPIYKPDATITSGKSQLYYINKISTSSHSLLFFKDVRKDAHSTDMGSAAITPKLKISRVVLLNNSDIDHNWFNGNLISGTNIHSDLNIPSTENNIYWLSQYDAHSNAVDQYSLRSIEFQHDYHLAKGAYNNIHNSANQTVKDNMISYQKHFENSDPQINEEFVADFLKGKLTLNAIKSYEYGGVAVAPKTKFEYFDSKTINGVTESFDYNHLKKDCFGHYKSDFDHLSDQYITSDSKNFVDAWSLKKVITPLGAELSFEYENDEYNYIGYDQGVEPQPIERAFLVNQSNGSDGNYELVMFSEEMRKITDDPDLFEDWRFAYNSTATYNDGVVSLSAGLSNSGTQNVNLNTDPGNDISFNPPGNHFRVDLKKAYGGGIRVKSVNYKDPSSNLSYAVDYEYDYGVATVEPDRFEKPGINSNLRKSFFGSDPLTLSPQVGYTRVKQIYNEEAASADSRLGYSEFIYRNFRSPFYFNQRTESNYSGYYTQTLHNIFTEDGIIEGVALWDVVDNQDYIDFIIGSMTGAVPDGQYDLIYGDPDGEALDSLVFNYPPNMQASYEQNLYFSSTDLELPPGSNFTSLNLRQRSNLRVVENTSLYGTIQSIEHFDQFGSSVNKKDFYYSHKNKGIKDEIFTGRVFVDGAFTEQGVGQSYYVQTNVFKKSTENSLLSKEVTTFSDGSKIIKEYKKRAPISGVPLETVITYPDKVDKLVEYPAYSQSEYGELGFLSMDKDHENIISPNYKSEVYRNGTLISASLTEFSKDQNFRVWNNTTNSYEDQTLTGLNWLPSKTHSFTDDPDESTWLLNGENILFSEKNHGLAAKDIKDYYTSSKLGYDDEHVIAQASNAAYAEIAYSGFENEIDYGNGHLYFDSEIKAGGNRVQSNQGLAPHTGQYMLNIPASSMGPIYTMKAQAYNNGNGMVETGLQGNRTYLACLWVQTGSENDLSFSIDLNSTAGVDAVYNATDFQSLTCGAWTKLDLWFTTPETIDPSDFLEVKVSNTSATNAVFIDDLRIQPMDAAMSSYVFNERRGLVTHALGSDNLYTRYVYDAAGTVIQTYVETDQGEKLVQSSEYQFARDVEQ